MVLEVDYLSYKYYIGMWSSYHIPCNDPVMYVQSNFHPASASFPEKVSNVVIAEWSQLVVDSLQELLMILKLLYLNHCQSSLLLNLNTIHKELGPLQKGGHMIDEHY